MHKTFDKQRRSLTSASLAVAFSAKTRRKKKEEKTCRSIHLSRWRRSSCPADPGRWFAASRADTRNSSRRRRRRRICALPCRSDQGPRESGTPWSSAWPSSLRSRRARRRTRNKEERFFRSEDTFEKFADAQSRSFRLLSSTPTRYRQKSHVVCPGDVAAARFYTQIRNR